MKIKRANLSTGAIEYALILGAGTMWTTDKNRGTSLVFAQALNCVDELQSNPYTSVGYVYSTAT